MSKRFWTAAQRRHLAEMVADGRPCAQIALALGRSAPAVRCQIAKMRRDGSLPPAGGAIGRGIAWCDGDDAVLIAGHRDGLSTARIAVTLGRTTSAVKHRARTLRDAGRIGPASTVSAAKGVDWGDPLFGRLWSCERITIAEIARHFGVSSTAVLDAARRRGFRARSDPYAARRPPDQERFRQLWQDGMMLRDIGRVFGVSASVARHWRRLIGLPPRRRVRGQGGASGWGSVPVDVAAEIALARRMSGGRRHE